MRLYVAALITSALTLAGCAKTPEATVEHLYRSVEKGELTEVRALMSKQLTQKIQAYGAQGDAEFASTLVSDADKYRGCGGIESIRANLAGEGETRSGTASITFKKTGATGCEALTERTALIKEDGAWKILQ